MKTKILLALFGFFYLTSCQELNDTVSYTEFQENDPAVAELLPERLGQVDQRIQSSIDKGEVAGTVAIIARNGTIGYHKAFGEANLAENKPMAKDALFRIASMSKLMTTVGALMLYEKGIFNMETALADILPEFRDPEVFEEWDEEERDFITRKAKNPILMKHILSHTSGIVYPIFSSEGREGYLAAGVQDGFPDMELTLEENIKRLATLPLAHDPGQKWTYGMNMDVLGRIIEVFDGRSFSQYMEEELFGPLGLEDTGFEVPEEDWDRVVEVYTTTEKGKLEVLDQEVFDRQSPNNKANWWKRDAGIIALGGAGIISTAYDYARFLQMLVNDGELEGTRILGRKTVELLSRPLFPDFDGKSTAMSLSVWVLENPEGAYSPASIGSFGWGGYFYTSYWADPEENLVAVIMNQVNPAQSSLNTDFVTLTYAALE